MTHIEVDQSGKIELMSQDTIISCSNASQYSIKIPKKVKQSIYLEKKNKVKQIKYKLFCIGVFHCIKRYLGKANLIVIDDEYQGKNNLIRSILIGLIKADFPNFDSKIIKFGNIGKKSNAHHLAIETLRKEHKPNETISIETILNYLK